jgi:hypothetical protein
LLNELEQRLHNKLNEEEKKKEEEEKLKPITKGDKFKRIY